MAFGISVKLSELTSHAKVLIRIRNSTNPALRDGIISTQAGKVLDRYRVAMGGDPEVEVCAALEFTPFSITIGCSPDDAATAVHWKCI